MNTELKWVRWRARLGFPLVFLCLYFARPTENSILLGGIIAFAGMLVRAAAAGHLRKSENVTSSGPYAHTRNPLYLGSAIMAIGFVVASRSLVAAILVAAYYLAFFPFLMGREEAELQALFGNEFREYSRSVPLFWPRFHAHAKNKTAFSWDRYLRNGEYNVTLGMLVLLAVLWALTIFRR